MLNAIRTKPYPKFILINGRYSPLDSSEAPARCLFLSLVQDLAKDAHFQIHVLCFENHPEKYKSWINAENVTYHDYFGVDWSNLDNIKSHVSQMPDDSILVIDSLNTYALHVGDFNLFEVLKCIQSNSKISQVIAVLHVDCVSLKKLLFKHVSHLATVTLSMRESFAGNARRLLFLYKKPGGKIIKQILEYWFDNTNKLLSKKVEKTTALPANTLVNKSAPENLSTFRISLGDEEKQSRDQVILPYIRSENTSGMKSNNGGGTITYELDEVDDWDEEDPDDDLDV